jgi:hypothetical protein
VHWTRQRVQTCAWGRPSTGVPYGRHAMLWATATSPFLRRIAAMWCVPQSAVLGTRTPGHHQINTNPSLAKLCPALTVLGPLGFHALHIMHRGLSHKLAIKASIKSPSTLFRACAASMMLTCHDLKHHRSVIHTERTPRHVNTIML